MANYPLEVERALALHFSVIPVGLNKRPAIPAWKEFQEHQPTTDQVGEWAKTRRPAWAIVTGRVSRRVVLDFDGEEGKRALEKLKLKAHVQTGSGGAHVYCEYPGHKVQTLTSKTAKRFQQRYPGVDIRADGGYAIFCGRSERGQYRVDRDLGEFEPWSGLPSDLRTMISDPAEPMSSSDHAERFLSTALDTAGRSSRNAAGFGLACQLRDAGLSQGEAAPFMRRFQQGVGTKNQHGQEEPYTWQEAQLSLASAYGGRKREPAAKPGADVLRMVVTPVSEPTQDGDTPSGPIVTLPPGFEMTERGLLYTPATNDPAVRLSDPFEVVYITHNSHGEDPGKFLRFADRYGRVHEVNITEEQLFGERTDWRQTLVRTGLRMSTGKREAGWLKDCLYHLDCDGRATRVDQIGWHEDVFVTPAYQVPDGTRHRFLHVDSTGGEYHFGRHGTHADWRDGVGRLCGNNPLLLFAVSLSLAPILLRLKPGLGGGFHFGGGTSTGKTTTLTVASSVWGNPKGFIQTWDATKNALEVLAHSHNHCLLCLDEVKELDAREAVKVAYMLANGAGKSRSNVNAQLRPQQRWELIFASTGELGYLEHAASTGQRTFGGQALRVLEIPSDQEEYGCFSHLHEFSEPAKFAQTLVEASRQNYGTAAPAFIEGFLACGTESVRARLKGLMELFRARFKTDGTAVDAERAVDRFALVAAAGELATEWGVTGWRTDEAMTAAGLVLELWFKWRGTYGSLDEYQAFKNFQGNLFRLASSHFEWHKDGQTIGDRRPQIRLGYRSEGKNGTEFHFPQEQGIPVELRGEYSQAQLVKALRARGALVCEADRPTTYRKIPEFPDRVRCFVVLQEKLFEHEKPEAACAEE